MWELLSSLTVYSTLVSSQRSGYGFTVSQYGMTSNDIGVTTRDDVQYLVNITLGGEDFTVILDTGSTDLWVAAQGRDVKLTNTTDLETSLVYGQGQVAGNIAFAELQVGEYVIPSQAFINATTVTNMPPGAQGILGMAFDNVQVAQTLQMAWGAEAADELGRAFITNVFAMNASAPNNFDVQLGRIDGPNDVSTGTFIISAHDAGYEDVTEAPKLPCVRPEHWSIVVDEMRINGEPFSFNKSSVSGVPQGKVIAILDTGFSLPPLPQAAVDAIYSKIPGAAFWTSPIINSWIIPCNSSTDLSFVFGGKEYPVHPLDLSLPQVFPILDNGAEKNVTVCVATYQYLNLDPTQFAGFDLILGDAFLRSVYASFDYGDYNPTNHTNGTPFVQMVSTVYPHSAMDEFKEGRAELLSALPPTIDPSVFVKAPLSPSVTGQGNATSTDSVDSGAVRGALAEDGDTGFSSTGGLGKYGVVALALLGTNLLVGVLIFAVTLTMCVRGVKGKSRELGSRYTPVRFKETVDNDPESGSLARYSDH
ncbi:acid protease [Lentinus tigrinus ALCF2SS1-7]|uniref:acid protease n=1 Tax=Lentinus tigrinus ALCF2SS1-7 TaxID=1328758 RepID=UPI001165E18B|nr:acid protease [Lentinus tigrinus ALCF2SS1-7]